MLAYVPASAFNVARPATTSPCSTRFRAAWGRCGCTL